MGATSWLFLDARVAFKLAKRSWLVIRARLRREAAMGMGDAIWVGMVEVWFAVSDGMMVVGGKAVG